MGLGVARHAIARTGDQSERQASVHADQRWAGAGDATVNDHTGERMMSVPYLVDLFSTRSENVQANQGCSFCSLFQGTRDPYGFEGLPLIYISLFEEKRN